MKGIQVTPGRNGNALPLRFGNQHQLPLSGGWTNSGDQNFDHGAIILPPDLGSTTGRFGFGAYPDADLLASTGNISGYPGDRPAGTQWHDSCRIASVDAQKVHYNIDTAGGQSGSAVNGARTAVGVHAYGGAVTNSATRITTEVYNNMVTWEAAT